MAMMNSDIQVFVHYHSIYRHKDCKLLDNNQKLEQSLHLASTAAFKWSVWIDIR